MRVSRSTRYCLPVGLPIRLSIGLPICLALAIVLVAAPMTAAAQTPSIECDGQQYSFEDGLFGASAQKLVGAEWQEFCVPDNGETLTQKLTIKGDEIWCLSYHHITPDTQPYARQSWMINTEIGTLQITDYLRRDGGWLKQSQSRIKCEMPAD